MAEVIARLGRLSPTGALAVVSPILAVLLAVVLGGVVIAAIGLSPVAAYRALWDGIFATPAGFGLAVNRAVPLLFVGLSVSLAFRGGMFNIGGEGQLYVGALASTLSALWLPEMPWALHFPLVVVASFLAGGVWGGFAGWLRVRYGLSEIITTIMLNYLGFWLVAYMVHGPLLDTSSYFPWSAEVPESTRFPSLDDVSGIHTGILLASSAAVLVLVLLWWTVPGFAIRVTGAGLSSARFAGIDVTRTTMLAMFLAGGLAGLAGTAEIHGVQLRLSDFFSPGYGFTGIAVALVGRTHPLGVIVAALFFGMLDAGSDNMQQTVAVPAAVIQLVQGMTILFLVIAGSMGLRHRLQRMVALRHVRTA